MRITDEQRRQTEDRIRAAADRILNGDPSARGKCDVKSLAEEAGVARSSLYGTYSHLKSEFERRRDELVARGDSPDPREAQIARLKQRDESSRNKIDQQNRAIQELQEFRRLAVSRLSAQHEEISRLRDELAEHRNVLVLSKLRPPSRGTTPESPSEPRPLADDR